MNSKQKGRKICAIQLFLLSLQAVREERSSRIKKISPTLVEYPFAIYERMSLCIGEFLPQIKRCIKRVLIADRGDRRRKYLLRTDDFSDKKMVLADSGFGVRRVCAG